MGPSTHGNLGPSFDGDGFVTTHISSATGDDRVGSVAIQQDGKIVTGGSAQNAAGSDEFAVARFNTNGTLDTHFNGTGFVTPDINGDGQ